VLRGRERLRNTRALVGFKDQCLDRMIFVGQESLRRAVDEYMDHHDGERNHQGLKNRLIHLPTVAIAKSGAVHRLLPQRGMTRSVEIVEITGSLQPTVALV
jgi:hypothetical protein